MSAFVDQRMVKMIKNANMSMANKWTLVDLAAFKVECKKTMGAHPICIVLDKELATFIDNNEKKHVGTLKSFHQWLQKVDHSKSVFQTRTRLPMGF